MLSVLSARKFLWFMYGDLSSKFAELTVPVKINQSLNQDFHTFNLGASRFEIFRYLRDSLRQILSRNIIQL